MKELEKEQKKENLNKAKEMLKNKNKAIEDNKIIKK